jgi:hypothetical protein
VDPPDERAQTDSINAGMRREISFYEKADVADFTDECIRAKQWRFLSVDYSLIHSRAFPGLNQADVRRYVDTGTVPYEDVASYGIVDEVFLGGSRELRDKLCDVREAYAARVNLAVLAEIVKEKAPKPQEATLPGVYTMIAGGFNESLLVELKTDGSYSMDHELAACDLSTITHSREEGGWKIVGGLVLLEPKARTKDFPDAPVFAPAAFRRLLPKRAGEKFLLVHPEYPTQWVLQKGRLCEFLFPFHTASKIPATEPAEPTPASFTPTARAPVVPPSGPAEH